MMNQDNDKIYNNIRHRIKRIKKMIGDKKSVDLLMKYNNEILESTEKDDIRHIISKTNISFGKAIKELGGQLIYIKSGTTGHTFKSIYENESEDNLEYAVKIVAYPKKDDYGDIYNLKRPENAELLMITLLSDFVKKNQTPHIVLPIATFNSHINVLLGIHKTKVDEERFDKFIERYNDGYYYDKMSVLISEWANSGDLNDYVKKNYKKFTLRTWKTIFFQLLSVLAIIQTEYPSFRHNDLKANNILVHETSQSTKCYKYIINGQEYVIPNIGFDIKLWDFDFACIPNIVDNNKVDAEWTTKINIKPIKHRYYDVHYFFTTFTSKAFFPQFWTDDAIPEKIKEFVLRIVPEKYRSGENITSKGRLLVDDEYLTPDQIIKTDKLFRSFREFKKYKH